MIDGKGSLENLLKKSNLLSFSINAQTPVKVVAHIQYFPGWRAYVDGNSVPIEFQYAIYRGEVVFRIPQGRHDVKLSFGESKLRYIADALTIVSAAVLALWGVLRLLKRR
ncbi:MAG: hypothetical protein Q7K55_09195 [Candidatus Levybacteria bacterium]|nr:hypothetical protein [Candidatus Levybacteria bacterium]